MNQLVKFSVKNSLFVNLLSLFIVFAGLFAIFSLKREAFPPVSFDVVSVTTSFRGASAEKVEQLVTTPIEKELREVDDIEEIYSSSSEGYSNITLKISEDAKNKAKVVRDIQSAVDRVTDLPKDVEERPRVEEITSGQIPVIKIGVSGDVDEFTLRSYTDQLQDLLEDIDGVSSVRKVGWRDEEYQVQPDIEKMRQYHISYAELKDALAAQNVELPGGKLKTDTQEFIVKVNAEFTNEKDIENTVVRANDIGNHIRVKDIATVQHTFADEVVVNKVLGTRAITLVIIKREKGDILKIVNAVNQILHDFKQTAPEQIKLSTFYDMSYYVNRRLTVLRSNGIIGFILVLIVLFIFLHPIPAIFTAMGIPIAMFATLGVMYWQGITINLMTMFGLITVLGMLVDDGIIISENVFRYIEKGMDPHAAAIKGAGEVMLPVLTTVLTTVAAFCPLLFMDGLIGRFIMYIPLVAIIALSGSLVEAFIILPSHLADFAHRIQRRNNGGLKTRKKAKWFRFLLLRYFKILKYAVNRKYRVLLFTWLLFIFSIFAAVKWIPFILFPGGGIETFYIRLEAKSGTNIETTNALISQAEKIVEALPEKYLDTYETIVGQIGEDFGPDPSSKQASNYAQINVYLTAAQHRDKDARQIMDLMRPQLEQLEEKLKPQGLERLYFQEISEGPAVGKPIDVRIRGEHFDTITKITNQIKDYIQKIKGVSDVADTYDQGVKNISIIIDEEKAQERYLTNAQIALAIRAVFSGEVATTIKRSKAEKEINVLVRLSPQQRNDVNVFEKVQVRNKFDNLVPLSQVIKKEPTQGLLAVRHLDGKRYVAVTGEVDDKNITSLQANRLIQKEFGDVAAQYPGYTMKFAGEQKETMESIRSLIKAFLIAFFLVFLILATLFNSIIRPFIVLQTFPFGVIGVVIGFLLHHEPLSFLAILGLVGLTGVVVNDSIVLVDFTIRQQNAGMSVKKAILKSGLLRFRPVILTTITTVAGLATVAYGIGGFDPFLRPMALAISWGLMFSTGLTLVVVPCVYAIVEDWRLRLHAFRKRHSVK